MSLGWVIKCWTWRRLNVFHQFGLFLCRPKYIFDQLAKLLTQKGSFERRFSFEQRVGIVLFFGVSKVFRLRLACDLINSEHFSSCLNMIYYADRRLADEKFFFLSFLQVLKVKPQKKRNKRWAQRFSAEARRREIKKLSFKGIITLCQ